jgi:hypothetical protein
MEEHDLVEKDAAVDDGLIEGARPRRVGLVAELGRTPRACRRRLVLSSLVLMLAACGTDPASPRGAAERFLDAYFGLDLAGAAQASASRARALVDEERRLTAGQRVDASTRVPVIRYRLEREDVSGEAVHLVYAIHVAGEDMDPSDQRWLLMVKRTEGSAWRVVNFQRLPD